MNNINIQLKVVGMSCSACALGIESQIKKVEGISFCKVNYGSSEMEVSYDVTKISLSEIKNKVEVLGYELFLGDDEKQKEALQLRHLSLKKRLILSACFCVPLFLLAMFFSSFPYGTRIQLILSIPILIYGGQEFFLNAWRLGRKGKTNMDTLVALGTGSAFIYSLFSLILNQNVHGHPDIYFESVGVIITFILLGRYLEEKAKNQTYSSIESLIALSPRKTLRYTGNKWVETEVSEIQKGDLLRVLPGEAIPVGGELKAGVSYIDESMVTGESLPLKKNMGDNLIAGTINGATPIEMIARRIGSETILAGIIEFVKNAANSKAPIQSLADKISSVFVPTIIIISSLTFCGWLFLGSGGFSESFRHALTVLIVACPCALGLATPTAVIVGMGKGAKNGILIKDAIALQSIGQIETLFLDKTGTITEGKPRVTKVSWMEKEPDAPHLSALKTLAEQSTHPLSIGIGKSLPDSDNPIILHGIESIEGKGIKGIYQGKKLILGSENFIIESGIIVPKFNERLGNASEVFFAVDKKLTGVFYLEDPEKIGVANTLKLIKSEGVTPILISGDKRNNVEAMANKLFIQDWHAQTLPTEKGQIIKEAKRLGKKVAMIGDGINDAPSLSLADVGISFENASGVAMSSAQIILLGNDFSRLHTSIRLGKKSLNTIYQNLFWAFFYNILAIPLASGLFIPFFGWSMHPMIAGVLMTLSSLMVMGNSLRLKFSKL